MVASALAIKAFVIVIFSWWVDLLTSYSYSLCLLLLLFILKFILSDTSSSVFSFFKFYELDYRLNLQPVCAPLLMIWLSCREHIIGSLLFESIYPTCSFLIRELNHLNLVIIQKVCLCICHFDSHLVVLNSFCFFCFYHLCLWWFTILMILDCFSPLVKFINSYVIIMLL